MLALPLSAADPVNFQFEDQFEAKPELKALRGKVVILVYGDRKASDECRTLGEKLHVSFHPTAKDLKPGQARQQPATDLPKVAAGKSPGVVVQAVACCGKMPALVKPLLRGQLVKASPEVPVWLDFNETMTTHFGLTTGQANVAVFDCEGRYRHRVSGTPTAAQMKELLQTVQNLRAEGVK